MPPHSSTGSPQAAYSLYQSDVVSSTLVSSPLDLRHHHLSLLLLLLPLQFPHFVELELDDLLYCFRWHTAPVAVVLALLVASAVATRIDAAVSTESLLARALVRSSRCSHAVFSSCHL